MAIAVRDLAGIYPAIITPMKADGEIDFPKLDRLIEDLIAAGVSGISACGTTGQDPVLTHSERLTLMTHIRHRTDGRCQFIAAAGSNSTAEALSASRAIEQELGATTFLHVTGYYNNPPQAGLLAHFRAIADGLKYPESNIIIYNVPSRTASNIEASTTIELAGHPRIAAIKESSRNLAQVREIIGQTDANEFRVLTGECDQIAATIAMGGFGSISATANIAPRLLTEMARAALQGDAEQARVLQEKAIPAAQAVFAAKNPIPLAMLFDSHLRLPLVTLPSLKPRLSELMAGYTAADLGVDLARYHDGF